MPVPPLSLGRLWFVLGGLVLASAGCGSPPAAGPELPTVPPLESAVPADAVFPLDAPEAADADADREVMSRFAWQTFVAVNWPALKGKRGVPDPDNAYRVNSGPTVWGTWKSLDELYPPDAKPTEWDSFDAAPVVGVVENMTARKQYPLKDRARANSGATKILSHMSSINQAFLAAGQEFGHPLVDQKGKLVRYEVRINPVAYTDLFTRKLFLREELDKLAAGAGVFPAGSIHVKAAWREMPEGDPALRDKYYCAEAAVIDGWNGTEPVMKTRVMGLVGLHVVQKAETRKSWVWSTFEHVDNVQTTFTNNPARPKNAPDANKPEHPHALPGVPFPTTPVQVVRRNDIHEKTARVNETFQAHPQLRDTPWRNYQLVGIQWAREKTGDTLQDDGIPPATTRMLPKAPVANVTMETFLQGFSCVGCHGPNPGRRFPFVFYPDFMAMPPKKSP